MAGALIFGCGLTAGLFCVSWPRWLLLSGVAIVIALGWRGFDGWQVWWLYPVGLIWGALALAAPWQNYRAALPRPECAAAIRGTLISLPQGPPEKMRATLALTAVHSGSGWQGCRGTIQLNLAAVVPHWRYGDQLEARGAFVLTPSEPRRGQSSYGQYLLSRGIRHQFFSHAVARRGAARGWRRPVRAFREARQPLADGLCHGIRTPIHAAMYQTMILGGNATLPNEVRDTFVRSGIVHIFSISGMHVTLMISAWALCLQALRLPFRWRWPLLIPLISGYVLLTGAAPAAARSLWMALALIAAVCSFRQPSLPNALGLSAWILLTANPLDLFHSGFVFSFCIVAVLLHGWPPLRDAINIALEKSLWEPRTRFGPFLNSRKHALLALAGSSGIAWLGSAGLTAFFNGQLSWGGLIANLALPLLTLFLVYAAIPKIVLAACCTALSAWLGAALDQALATMILIARLCAGNALFQNVRPWSIELSACYYGALALLIAARQAAPCRWLAGAIMALCIAWGCLTAPRPTPALLCCQGDDGGAPALCLLGAGTAEPVVLYPGSREAANGLVTALLKQGIGHIDWLLIPTTSRDRQGAMAILNQLPVRNVAMLATPRQESATAKSLQALRAQGVNTSLVSFNSNGTRLRGPNGARATISRQGHNNEFTLHYALPDADLTLTCSRSRFGPCRITWSANGISDSRTVIPSRKALCQLIPMKIQAVDKSPPPY